MEHAPLERVGVVFAPGPNGEFTDALACSVGVIGGREKEGWLPVSCPAWPPSPVLAVGGPSGGLSVLSSEHAKSRLLLAPAQLRALRLGTLLQGVTLAVRSIPCRTGWF